MKKLLGRLKRGAVGRLENARESAPPVPADFKKQSLATSTQNRDIPYYIVGSGKRKITLIAGTHGNEVGTVKLAHFLLNWLTTTDFPNLTFYIVPCLNPDGYAQAQQKPDYLAGGRIGRFNGRNVDLNRNFPTKSFQSKSVWTHGKNYTERTEVFCGEQGASEPEIKGLTELIKNEKIEVYFSFHSAGRDVMGSTTELGQSMARLFSEVGIYRFTTLEDWEVLHQTGTAKEWCDENKIAYIEVEASTRWGSDWQNQKPAIQACLEWLNRH